MWSTWCSTRQTGEAARCLRTCAKVGPEARRKHFARRGLCGRTQGSVSPNAGHRPRAAPTVFILCLYTVFLFRDMEGTSTTTNT